MAKRIFNGEQFEIFSSGRNAVSDSQRLWRHGVRVRTRGDDVFVHQDDIARAEASI